jgi:hypothetical protein
MITSFHAKYFAHELTRRHGPNDAGRLSQSLFDASVDLNPHQIEAALFALKSPLSKGVLLADEVGLGKTIEAGIVLCQYWSERRRRLLVICPASLRKQWALELEEKFNLPSVVLDAKTSREFLKKGQSPLNQKAVVILSYNYANKIRDELKAKDSTRPVPMHLRNAPTKLMKELDYGKGYRYAHDEEGGFAAGEQYMPDGLEQQRFYHPVERGLEIRIAEKMRTLHALNQNKHKDEA